MPESKDNSEPKLLHIGELAKAVGKSSRALHLYEELGLLAPAGRSKGGFRLYDDAARDRVRWILKLQNIGFTLGEIQGFVRDFESASSGRDATGRVRAIFQEKLAEVRASLESLRASETDLLMALEYLDACVECSPELAPVECQSCGHNGHEPEAVPPLFAGLSESLAEDTAYDVPITTLQRAKGQGSSS